MMTGFPTATVEASGRPPPSDPSFAVISGAQAQCVLHGRENQIVALVEATYRLHSEGDSVNPPSYLMYFPDRPSARMIALPASIGGGVRVDGLTWISNFPGNVATGLPRTSAVLILNDHDTGYPFACLESSIIGVTRTAASAALAASWLSRCRRHPARAGFVGTGLVARYIHTFLVSTGWSFEEVGIHDTSAGAVSGFREYLERTGAGGRIAVHSDIGALIRSSDLVVFATLSRRPYVHEVSWFAHGPLVLHVSLRDLAPEVVLASANIVDDVEHSLIGRTSLRLAERLSGNRDFLNGTLADVMAGRVRLPRDGPMIFSPFGLGVLDLAVGKYVYDEVARSGHLRVVDDFFHERRWYS
jgi:2,3-diaminopropionate biosynthesis protein SbnB